MPRCVFAVVVAVEKGLARGDSHITSIALLHFLRQEQLDELLFFLQTDSKFVFRNRHGILERHLVGVEATDIGSHPLPKLRFRRRTTLLNLFIIVQAFGFLLFTLFATFVGRARLASLEELVGGRSQKVQQDLDQVVLGVDLETIHDENIAQLFELRNLDCVRRGKERGKVCETGRGWYQRGVVWSVNKKYGLRL